MSETGALSVEDAVAHLSAEEAVEDQPQTTDQPEIEDDAPETASEEDDQTAGDEDDDAEPEAEVDPEQPAIDPPASWDAEHKAKFATLPRDVQEYLLARETERDRGVSAQQQRASEARQRAEAEAQAVAALKPQIETLAEQARQQLDRWSGMDATAWQNLAQTDPNRYVALKAQHDADVQRVQQLDAAREKAEAVEWQAFANKQTARLPEIAPNIAGDPKVQAEVFEYIVKSDPDIKPEDVRWITAEQMVIAHKAMLYDRAQAPQPKPQGKKVITAKPSTPPAPMQQRQRSQAEQAFKKAPTVENALKLLG